MLGEDTKPPTRAAGVSGDAIIYHGALVGPASDGYMAPATTAIRPTGVADLEMWNDQAFNGQAAGGTLQTPGYKIDATGVADGVRKLVVRHGVIKCLNKSGDEVTAVLINAPVYVEDDQTVRATAAGTVVAGILHGFADDGLPLVLIESAALA
jgi:hypothetical protein